jgi:serine/threonine protein kinase
MRPDANSGSETLEPSVEQALDDACDRFERAWKAGGRPALDDYLGAVAEAHRPALVRELILLDVYYRRQAGEDPQPADYGERCPTSFPTWIDPLATAPRARPGEAGPGSAGSVGRQLGGYELLEELGRGGMGVVYKARQTGLGRVVALKLIRTGEHAGAAERARFRAEAEVVARLSHPNIVPIYEAGEADGLPFFSLEFVDGPTLAELLAGTPQPAEQSARLVETLARAVHFAHERGVIHRDLKPANVLLQRKPTTERTDYTDYTDKEKKVRQAGASRSSASAALSVPSVLSVVDFLPKITDFGLARRVEGSSALTHTGDILGTPSYMAPEQAEGRARELGPLVDVWALGAILYEALTGRPPFHGTSAMETMLQVRSAEPVPPTRLQPKAPRDLETICLKCLEKDPHRRYATAADLADDLGRFLTRQPIRARPVGAWERALKWARRRPTVAALVGVSAFALVSLLVAGWWSSLALSAAAERERAQRRLAEEHFGRALEAVDQLLAEVAHIDLAGVPHMEQRRRNLLLKAVRFYQDFLDQRGDDPTVRQHAGRVYSRLGDIREMLNEDGEAERAYDRALALLEEPGELARAHNNRGVLLKKRGNFAPAELALRRALQLRQQLADDHPNHPDSQRDLADSHYHLGALLAPLAGREQQARAAYQRALTLQKELAARDGRAEYRRDLARTCNNLGKLLWQTGQRPAALQAFEQSLDVTRQLARDFPHEPVYSWDLARAHNNRASALRKARPDQAERAYQEAEKILADLAADFPTVPRYQRERAAVCANLGRLLHRQRRTVAAEAALGEARRLRAKLARDYQSVPAHRHELARTDQEIGVLLQVSRPAEAERAYRRALANQEPLVARYPGVSEYREDLVRTLDYLARLLLRRGQLGEISQGVDLLLPGLAPRPLAALAVPARARAALVEAGRCLELAIRHQRAARTGRASLARLHFALADVRVRLGQHERAAAAAEQLPRLSPERVECLRAAQFLAKCTVLAGQDPTLTERQRDERAQDYRRRGVQLLRQAVERGFKNARELQAPAYAPLRGRELRKLVEELEENDIRVG